MKTPVLLLALALSIFSAIAAEPNQEEPARRRHFKVLSVGDGGLLAEEFSPGYRDRGGATIAIVCDVEGFTDEQSLTAILRRDGEFKYTDTAGAGRTVKKYRAESKPVEYNGP